MFFINLFVSEIIKFISFPTNITLPFSKTSGLSVESLKTNTGLPKVGASSWIPPESDIIKMNF